MFFGNFEIAVFLKTAKAVLIYRGGKIDTAAFFEMLLVDAAVQAQPHDDKFFGTFGRREFLKTARVSRGINPVADTETPVRRFADADIVVSLPVKKVVTAGQTVIGDFILRVAVTIQIIIGKSVHFRGGVFAQRTNAFGGKTVPSSMVSWYSEMWRNPKLTACSNSCCQSERFCPGRA